MMAKHERGSQWEEINEKGQDGRGLMGIDCLRKSPFMNCKWE